MKQWSTGGPAKTGRNYPAPGNKALQLARQALLGGRAFRCHHARAIGVIADEIRLGRRRAGLQSTLLIATLGRILLGPAGLSILNSIGAKDSVIMLRMLEIVFRRDAITGSRRVARHGQVFLQDLGRRTAHFHVGPRTVECLGSGGLVGLSAVTAPRPFRIGNLSHTIMFRWLCFIG